MKKNKNYLNVLKYDYPYRFTFVNIPKYIRQFFRNIKWAYQRIVWGYCERDTFDLYCYYSHLFYNTLTYFAEHLNGYPAHCKDENEWKKYLHDMAAHFYNSIEDMPDVWSTKKAAKLWGELQDMCINNYILNPILKDGYTQEDYDKKNKEWMDAEYEANNFSLNEAKIGLSMMQKVYFNLWD